jgi:hypothetical protein
VNKGLPLEGVHSAHNYKFARYYTKVKQSHYRPGQALRVPGRRGSRISRQSAREGGKVSLKAPAGFTPQAIFLVPFLLEAESTLET